MTSSVILFGAGASYGSGEAFPTSPPLGKNLYRELAKNFPMTWGSFPAELQQIFNNNFEIGMSTIWNRSSFSIPVLMQHMGLYFISFGLYPGQHIKNAYFLLIQSLIKLKKITNVRFSSINYDCLFEYAASYNSLITHYFTEKQVEESMVIFRKLHGSCTFLPDGTVNFTRLAQYSSGVIVGGGIQPALPESVIKFCKSNTSLYPVMCIYMEDKPVQIAKESIEKIQRLWTKEVRNASKVIVVGVAPNSRDKHIWDVLANAPGKLMYVGNEESFNNWKSAYRNNKESIFLGNRFSSCVDTIVELI